MAPGPDFDRLVGAGYLPNIQPAPIAEPQLATEHVVQGMSRAALIDTKPLPVIALNEHGQPKTQPLPIINPDQNPGEL